MSKYGFDDQRLLKRQSLLDEGVEAYPYSFAKKQDITEVVEQALKMEAAGEAIQLETAVAGRIWSKREMGKAVFLDLKDSTAKIQLYCNQKILTPEEWQVLSHLETGDLLGVFGEVFRTQKNELSIRAHRVQVLAKTVVPIPFGKETDDKVFYRLSDPESKYRERYLHWMLDEVDRKRIETRAAIISAVRRRMEGDGFLEVSTPTLEFVYGGAEARPFKTSIWALSNKESFLRISPELYLKRYIVAGYEKVFTICQNFRNEGIDKSHNPEFTMMEWYEAYTDYEFQMQRFENLVAGVCQDICGSTRVKYQDTEIDFKPPWERLTVVDALAKYAGLQVSDMSVDELSAELEKREGKKHADLTWGLAVARLFELCCEEHLIQPVFIMDHPVEISPLTKIKRGNDRLVERFEPFVCGMEIGNAYSELTDPVIQLERLTKQREIKEEDQGYENHPVDADFVRAIGCGMPPTGGVGIGIDRIVMLLTDASTIRDIIPFPMIKPKE